jgi:hypothetical protein
MSYEINEAYRNPSNWTDEIRSLVREMEGSAPPPAQPLRPGDMERLPPSEDATNRRRPVIAQRLRELGVPGY